VLARILTPEVTAWLVDADPEIMRGLLSAVARIDDGAVLGSLVAEADQASVGRDLRENHIDPAAASLGVPMDRYLLDAMRRRARGGKWQINVAGAHLWMLAEGLHLFWPAAAQDVVGVLAADKVPGIPRDPDTLADILLRAWAHRRGEGRRGEPAVLASGAGTPGAGRASRHALHAASRLARFTARGGAPCGGRAGGRVRAGDLGPGHGDASGAVDGRGEGESYSPGGGRDIRCGNSAAIRAFSFR
jgi:hypothetical protein